MTQDPNDFLKGGGAPPAKFEQIGDLCKGVVLSAEVKQQTEPGGKLKFYDDGNAMMQLVVTVQTEQNDPQVSGDDGKRRLFVKGQMRAAIASAVESKQTTLENGGTLVVKYVADKPSETRGYSPAKQFEAAYRAPTNDAANDMLSTPEPAPAAAGPSADDLI